ncbi:cytochrome c biogenesis CcdA family protein [Daeguia caeni]|uniref:Cytochrome c biogenesis CcdA family protein n=1 Tax=Daeguia caeni TaxID=439612 RepID=A0ABV9H621_9HYPH
MNLVFAFVAGVVTVLSPCVLPLLPIILASSTLEGRGRPIGLIVGFAVFFTTITLALSLVVRQFAISPDINRTTSAVIFILLGLVLVVPAFKVQFELVASRFTARFGMARGNVSGFPGGFLAGAGLGLAWTPCVGPIMASVITLALNQQTTLASASTAIAFSLGTALPMGLAVYFGNRLYSRTHFLKQYSARIQQLMGLVILLVGFSIWFGVDRVIQIALFRAFPGWDAALTGWERSLVK